MDRNNEDILLPAGSTCLTCGYGLHTLHEARCPECGLPFNPADGTTYRDPREHPARYFWTTAPPAWHVAGIVVATMVLLVAGSAPHFGTAVILASRPTLVSVALVIVLAVVLDYAKRALRRLPRLWRRRLRTSRTTSEAWRWFVAPACGAVLGSAVLTDWPLRLRFSLSLSAFHEAAADFYAAPQTTAAERWIGWYHVREIRPRGAGAILATHSAGRECLGFAYLPESAAAPADNEVLRPLAPPWYVYAQR